MRIFPYEILSPEKPEGTSYIITIKVPVTKAADQAAALQFIRSQAIKDEVYRTWMSKHAPNYGMEVRGGPRPVFEKPSDRSSPVVAYEVDYRISQRM